MSTKLGVKGMNALTRYAIRNGLDRTGTRSPIDRGPISGPRAADQAGWARTMMRSSVMSSMAQRRPSRPSPESLTPPYGMWSIR